MKHESYAGYMSGTYALTVGNRGQIVLPAELRERAGLGEGTELVLVESPEGLALLTRDQLKQRVRSALEGQSLVDALLAERREAAKSEDTTS